MHTSTDHIITKVNLVAPWPKQKFLCFCCYSIQSKPSSRINQKFWGYTSFICITHTIVICFFKFNKRLNALLCSDDVATCNDANYNDTCRLIIRKQCCIQQPFPSMMTQGKIPHSREGGASEHAFMLACTRPEGISYWPMQVSKVPQILTYIFSTYDY